MVYAPALNGYIGKPPALCPATSRFSTTAHGSPSTVCQSDSILRDFGPLRAFFPQVMATARTRCTVKALPWVVVKKRLVTERLARHLQNDPVRAAGYTKAALLLAAIPFVTLP